MLTTNKWTEKRMNNQQLPVKLNATELKLSFDDHIDKLCNKLRQRIAMLRRMYVYGPRAPLGICIGFFISRGEVHTLSLTPTGEQTVLNCL